MSVNLRKNGVRDEFRVTHPPFFSKLYFCSTMESTQPNNPLHGITLEQMLNDLVANYGWEQMSAQVDIRCFKFDPSIKSSLAFLRKTPWARTQVEKMYLQSRK
ncbi:hypothetical protein BH11BAC1_BH11BAC1_23590 [soil metagenome]